MAYPQSVETARLTLRRLQHGDADAFLSIWADPHVWRAIRPGKPFDSRHGSWGRGIATEGAHAAVFAALAHLRPSRLISLIDPRNVRSIAVAKRLEMTDLGPVEHGELGLELRLYSLDATSAGTP